MNIIVKTSSGTNIVELTDQELEIVRHKFDPKAECLCCQERPSNGNLYCDRCAVRIMRNISFGCSQEDAVRYARRTYQTVENLNRQAREETQHPELTHQWR